MSTNPAQDVAIWGPEEKQVKLIARNMTAKYVATGIELALGIVMLPFNLRHLGPEAYGLWMLVVSFNMYFSMLDLGYGPAQEKFIAKYRALRDREALNQVVSTMFFLFLLIGIAAYAIGAGLSLSFERFFKIDSDQVTTGRYLMLIFSAQVALSFPASVFGAVVNAFQRPYINAVISIIASVLVAAINYALLSAGYGLIALVSVTTLVRLLSYVAYRINAYRVFPGLSIRPKFFRRSRLREVTGFSLYLLVIDLANKLNYSSDTMVIGAFLGTAAIASWAVAQRLSVIVIRLTNQLNSSLFQVIVASDTVGQDERLRLIFLQGTRLSLAMVVPVATALAMLAQPLIFAWVGPNFTQSVVIIQILAAVTVVRVGNATSTTLMKGAGQHRALAIFNIIIALANIGLSVVLVQFYGLIGVAMGTLIPLAAASIFGFFPFACRRVGVSVGEAFRSSVWPSLWPAGAMVAFLFVTRPLVAPHLLPVAVLSVLAALLYAGIFIGLAINSEERQWYKGKVKDLFRRRRKKKAPSRAVTAT